MNSKWYKTKQNKTKQQTQHQHIQTQNNLVLLASLQDKHSEMPIILFAILSCLEENCVARELAISTPWQQRSIPSRKRVESANKLSHSILDDEQMRPKLERKKERKLNFCNQTKPNQTKKERRRTHLVLTRTEFQLKPTHFKGHTTCWRMCEIEMCLWLDLQRKPGDSFPFLTYSTRSKCGILFSMSARARNTYMYTFFRGQLHLTLA